MSFTKDELQLIKDAIETCWAEWAQYDIWRTDLYISVQNKILELMSAIPSNNGKEAHGP